MKKFFNIKSYIGLVVALFIAFVSLFEIIDYKANPIDYQRVYHIGSVGVEWKYESGQNLVTWNVGIVTLSVLYVVANLFYLFKFKKNKFLQIILLCVEISWLVWIVWFLFDWYSAGFDH